MHAAIRESASEAGYVVLEVDGRRMKDKQGVFVEVALKCPLDPSLDLEPPIDPRRLSWDALSDSLGAGLLGLDSEAIALLWSDAHVLLLEDTQVFTDSIRILDSLVNFLRRRPKSCVIFSPILFMDGSGPVTIHDDYQ